MELDQIQVIASRFGESKSEKAFMKSDRPISRRFGALLIDLLLYNSLHFFGLLRN